MREAWRFRPEPLRAAAILAAAFVVFRVVYRALFNGLDRGGALLLDLPSFRLPDPVDHIVLLGPVTAGGLVDAVRTALPIAAIVLAFGVLNAFLDVPHLCARASRGGPLSSIARALVIAWATFPALTRSVHDVRRARRLRGERGLASLLVPVMERTVERAVALGASMEVRGFAGDAPASPLVASAAVELHGVTIAHDGGPTLRFDLTIAGGSLTLVTGPTGSGKSTLLRAISGLHTGTDGGTLTGDLLVAGLPRDLPPRATAAVLGLVAQAPRLGFVAETVAAEIAFASEVQGASAAEVATRVDAVSRRLDVTHLLAANPATLSAGEAMRVALAAAVAHEPRVLLVDEPLADLDPEARRRTIATLVELARSDDVAVVLAEHRADEVGDLADRRLAVVPAGEGETDAPREPGRGNPGALVAHVTGVRVAYGERIVVANAALDLRAGEIVAIGGENGSGKTSLLAAIALPRPGTVTVAGDDVARLPRRARLGAVALVPDTSDDLLFALTVAAECARADRTAGRARGETARRFLTFADPADPAATLERHPRDLSLGQRRLLVLAIQLAASPRVLLIDEPSRGLDPRASAALTGALRTVAAAGTAVVLATHDAAFTALADRALLLRDGELVPR